MSFFKKLTDFVMPVDDEEEFEEEEVAEEKKKTVVKETREDIKQNNEENEYEEVPMARAVGGGGAVYATPSYTPYTPPRPSFAPSARGERPQLKVHSGQKDGELSVKLHSPTEYAAAPAIADDLNNNKAVIVNYERVQPQLQRHCRRPSSFQAIIHQLV